MLLIIIFVLHFFVHLVVMLHVVVAMLLTA